MSKVLIIFHCEQNTGYAIGRLEKIFYRAMKSAINDNYQDLHISYTKLHKNGSDTLPENFSNFLELDINNNSSKSRKKIINYISENQIDTIFAFDQQPKKPIYKHFRKAGVTTFISYWGAPMSSLMPGWKRFLKRIEMITDFYGPDLYIFESKGMAKTATHGRGIKANKTEVIYLGVDPKKFKPEQNDRMYVFDELDIDPNRHIFIFSGHMEERKGPQVIMRAANILASQRKKDDWQFLLLGNTADDEQRLLQELSSKKAKEHVLFAGYRKDIEKLHRGCYAGVIASYGWDSLTCSSLEMQSSGLPLLLSNLAGLNEAIIADQTGLLFEPNDHVMLAQRVNQILDNPSLRDSLSLNARKRIETSFTEDIQIQKLAQSIAKAQNGH